MRVFLVGAGGAIGRRLVPQLVAAGHEVVGTTTNPAKTGDLRSLGAEPVVLDVLDREATIAAVRRAEPDAIVHQATALSGKLDLRRFERTFARTSRLRTEGTDNLLEATRAAGVERVVAQSYAGWPAARTDGPIKTEDDPIDQDPPPAIRSTLAAILQLERAVTAAGGLALRYGGFYGPGTSLAPGGEHVEAIRKRQFPVVGNGAGIWSFIHVDDAAAATVAALEHGAPGVYNVVDDEPAPVAEWLPFLAELIGAKPPRHFPRWLGRLFAGEHGVVMMTEIRGASNAKAKRELGWSPRYPSYRVGFPAVLGGSSAADHGSPGTPTATSGSSPTSARPPKQSTIV